MKSPLWSEPSRKSQSNYFHTYGAKVASGFFGHKKIDVSTKVAKVVDLICNNLLKDGLKAILFDEFCKKIKKHAHCIYLTYLLIYNSREFKAETTILALFDKYCQKRQFFSDKLLIQQK